MYVYYMECYLWIKDYVTVALFTYEESKTSLRQQYNCTSMKETSHLTDVSVFSFWVRAVFTFTQAKSSACCLITELFCAKTNFAVMRMREKDSIQRFILFYFDGPSVPVSCYCSACVTVEPVWACLSLCEYPNADSLVFVFSLCFVLWRVSILDLSLFNWCQWKTMQI